MGRGVGFDIKRVVIDEIISKDRLALCLEPDGTVIQVPTHVRRSKAGWPQVGEQWLISREFGTWTFAAIIGASPAPPTVASPSDTTDPVVVQLFDALLELGLIQTPGRGGALEGDSPGDDLMPLENDPLFDDDESP